MDPDSRSSIVRLNIGGMKFCTSVDTLTQREPQSMLAAMFSGRHTVYKDSEKGYVFVDRDGKHFRHILNWLRDGLAPNLSDFERLELLREAEYYQLLGLVGKINEVSNKKKEDAQMVADLTRGDIIKYVGRSQKKYIGTSQGEYVRLTGVNLCALDLSKLDLSNVYLSYACLKNVNFSHAILEDAKFLYVDAENANFDNATLRGCEFTGANLRGARLAGANLYSIKLQDACLIDCSLCGADMRYANLESADLTNANLEGANLKGTNLKGAKLNNANLKGAIGISIWKG